MMTYNKIETLYARDIDGSKQLMEGVFRSNLIESLQNIPWRFTEKIDGTNIRICWDGHNITFGGRTDKAQIPVDLVNYLNQKFRNVETEEMFEQTFGENEVVFFGEGYGPKIQSGHKYRDEVSFILFDVAINGRYQEWENMMSIARKFDIDVVDVIPGIENFTQAVAFVKTSPKSFHGAADMEGVVGRPAYMDLYDRNGNRAIVKIKKVDFK